MPYGFKDQIFNTNKAKKMDEVLTGVTTRNTFETKFTTNSRRTRRRAVTSDANGN